MIRRLQELSRCTSLNPSLCCVKWTGSSKGDAEKEEEGGRGTGGACDTWVVSSSGDRVIALNPSVPSEQHRSVKVQLDTDCSATFLLSNSLEEDPLPEVAVCLSNGEVHLLSVSKCIGALTGGKGKRREKRSASVSSMDPSAKRFREETATAVPTSLQPSSSKVQNQDDIFISLLDSDDDHDSDNDVIVSDSHSDDVQEAVSTTSAIAMSKDVGGLIPTPSSENVVSFADVSSFWFVRKHRHQVVLSGHQLGKDTLLLQVGEPPGNRSVKLEVYQWKTEQHSKTSLQLVSCHSIPIKVPTVPEEPGFVPATLPLPLSIVRHQSGNRSRSWFSSEVISSGLYQQLFGPELALSEVPILLLGTPSGEVLYTPIANMFTPVSAHDIFAPPLCSLSQVVKGIHPIRLHCSDVCDGLVVTGGRGKVYLCTEGKGEERGMRSLRIESLHAGFAILASCTVPPCLLIMSGLKYVKVVDFTLATGPSGGKERNVLLQQLNRAFYRASRIEVAEVIRLEPIAYTALDNSSCVLFDFDGNLSVIGVSKKALDEHQGNSIASSSSATVKERIAAKMQKLRRLEGEGENAAEKLQKVEGYIREVNMAMHTIHLLATGKETAFKVEEVTTIETGSNDSCCVKLTLSYTGHMNLGAGWSLVLSTTDEGEGLHVMHLPQTHRTIDGSSDDGSHGDGAAHSSTSPLEGMPPDSLCHCYLTLPSHVAIQPLLLTCTLRYDTSQASKYLGQKPACVSGVILKKLLSLLDFMQPVPANVHISSLQNAESRTTGLKPISASVDGTDTTAIRILRETVDKCVISTGNHDNETVLHQFLHFLAGQPSRRLPMQSIGKDVVQLKLVMPDGSVFWLSTKCVSGGKLESFECVCKSCSYNILMAGTDAVIDRIGCAVKDHASSTSHAPLTQQDTTMETKALISEVTRCARLVREMKGKGPLEPELIDKVKSLNTEVTAFKSQTF